MFAPARLSIPQLSVYAASFLIQAACGLNAQNFTARSGGLNPFGVNGPLPFGQLPDFGGGAGLKGGFAASVGLMSTYDSNILLSENDPESDVSISVTPTLTYTTDPEGGAPRVISANYSPSANASFNNSDYNSYCRANN